MLTLEDHITDRVRAADYADWRARVEGIGGCAKPIHLRGGYHLVDLPTAQVIHEHSGDIMVPCGNRRASVCPTCSDRYAADAFHLIRAGLAGGSKGIPEQVTAHPRAFVTVTAPSFGPVHNQPAPRHGGRRRCACGQIHSDLDTRLGAPLHPDEYDYEAAVLWQAHAGVLWSRLVTYLRRAIARHAGIPVRALGEYVRVSYGKVAEYQRRGLVHFHAVIRLDGPDGPTDPPPTWGTRALLEDAVHHAVSAVSLTTQRPAGTPLVLRWGAQLDIRHIDQQTAEQVEDPDGQISEARLASYIAKYATKGTGKSEAADKPIRSQLDIDHLKISDHHRRIIQTTWDLGALPQYEELNLRHWAHMLAFRGHFLTKSRHYSATFKSLREDRHTWRLHQTPTAADLDPNTTLLLGHWDFIGIGYKSDAERELASAIAERTREARKQKYEQENTT